MNTKYSSPSAIHVASKSLWTVSTLKFDLKLTVEQYETFSALHIDEEINFVYMNILLGWGLGNWISKFGTLTCLRKGSLVLTYPCHFVKSACISHQCSKNQGAAENGHLDEDHFQIAQTHYVEWNSEQSLFHSCQSGHKMWTFGSGKT